MHLPALDFFRARICKTCDLEGFVGDCGCDFQTVNRANQIHFYPTMKKLVRSTFFRYFKVNLNKECPFWDGDHMCSIRDCEVKECESGEVPPVWIERDSEGKARRACVEEARDAELQTGVCNATSAAGDVEPELERALGELDRKEAAVGVDSFAGWAEGDNKAVWIEQDAEDEGMIYVNLLRNPERFTGYAGPSAWRVWRAIYSENCFDMGESTASAEQCYEKRVFFRLISGLQSSISTHLALEYFDRSTGQWVRNTKLFIEKVGAFPERINNLYFTYLFLLRAISKAGPDLLNYDYDTGNPADDAVVRENIKALVMASSAERDGSGRVVQGCRSAFDETGMFQPRRGPAGRQGYEATDVSEEEEMLKLRQDIFMKFHNISRIMDCVGCEKCRVWGKLQTLGLGTAIKILLGMPADKEGGSFSFQRNEVIALVNTAHQLAKSVDAVDMWQELEFDEIVQSWSLRLGTLLLMAGVFLLTACWTRRRRARSTAKQSSGRSREVEKAPGSSGNGVSAGGHEE